MHKSFYISATPEAVFDALTCSDDIIKYYPLIKVTSEWKVGGDLILDGEIDGNSFRDHGVIQALSRPTQFSYSYWSTNHGTERTPESHLTIAYRLSPEQQGTRLDVEQSNIRSEDLFGMMGPIWDSLLTSLKTFVESRALPAPGPDRLRRR